MPRGRTPKIGSISIRREILTSLRKGVTRKDAACLARINPCTLTRWLKRGKDPEAAAVYRDFRRDVQKAERKAKVDSLSAVIRAQDGDWKAAAWYLERRYPDEWGRNSRVRVDGTVTAEVRISTDDDFEAVLEDDEMRALLDQMALRNAAIAAAVQAPANGNGNGNGA